MAVYDDLLLNIRISAILMASAPLYFLPSNIHAWPYHEDDLPSQSNT
jgi:hypothetical protein